MLLFVFMRSSENAIRYLIGYYQPAVIGQQPSSGFPSSAT